MKLLEIARADFFDHSDPAQLRIAAELDHFTASPNVRLRPSTLEFLGAKYSGRSGSATLYRAMVFDSLEDARDVLGTEAEAGAKFTYRRDKESSWTRSKRFAYGFAVHGDMDEQYTVVLRAVVPARDFLLDVLDLSQRDLEHIALEDQSEVIVNADDREVTIEKVIDNHD